MASGKVATTVDLLLLRRIRGILWLVLAGLLIEHYRSFGNASWSRVGGGIEEVGIQGHASSSRTGITV